MIGIINYGSGNIYAIANIYKRLDIAFSIVASKDELTACDKLVLPGVGAFDETMKLIKSNGMKDTLDTLVLSQKIPIIGVCVGMQILGDSSEEGTEKGFGWIAGSVNKLEASQIKHKPCLPHLGWNNILLKSEHTLLQNIDFEKGFYFLHNYYFKAARAENVLATATYGIDFPCVIHNDNVYGVQFHPEKSHDNGVELFRNFSNL